VETSPVDLATAAAYEGAEIRAWADAYAAIPPDYAPVLGADASEIAGTLVHRCRAFRAYFNRAIGLGVIAPATPETVDAIIEHYRAADIPRFILQAMPQCRPAEFETWLLERGLRPVDAQDRVARGGEPLDVGAATTGERHFVVERVERDGRDEWADFLQRVYRLDAGPWLHELHGRLGWHQYVAREQGEIVAARGMYLGEDGMAWLGMDGPVPGITTQDYAPDAALCAGIVADGLTRGARGFIADIEAPSQKMDTPAYQYFARLGFQRPYTRTHYTLA
jgi:hypothetical protein